MSKRNEKGLSPTKATSPNEEAISSRTSLSQKAKKINPLRDLRVNNNIPAADIVAEVQKIYPKYDKMLQSKCEHGDEYGICLRRDAMEALVGKYAAESTVKVVENRKLKNRLYVRLSDEDYSNFKKAQAESGFTTVQNFLTFLIRNYLGKEDRA
ncbi:MAG: hypothetical protein ACI4F5_06295 [Acutalibacteraceae bacterium]